MSFPQEPGAAPPPSTAEQEYRAAGVTPGQLAAFARMQAAQTPAEYMAAAQEAGLTGQAMQAAAGQVAAGVPAGPIQAPSFEEQLEEYRQKNQALETQLGKMSGDFQDALTGLQQQLAGVKAAVPQKVDPVTESAAKVARAFADVAASDARNILASALRSHLVNLGLEDLSKAL